MRQREQCLDAHLPDVLRVRTMLHHDGQRFEKLNHHAEVAERALVGPHPVAIVIGNVNAHSWCRCCTSPLRPATVPYPIGTGLGTIPTPGIGSEEDPATTEAVLRSSQLAKFRETMVSSLWFLPSLLVGLAAAVFGLVWLELWLGAQVVARWPLVLNAEPEAAADEHTKQEIMALYRELAKLVMERVAEGGGNG
jgi:hypothetical protein